MLLHICLWIVQGQWFIMVLHNVRDITVLLVFHFQGETNLECCVSMLHQLDSTVPSISSMKIIRLPGFTPPALIQSSLFFATSPLYLFQRLHRQFFKVHPGNIIYYPKTTLLFLLCTGVDEALLHFTNYQLFRNF